MSNVKDTIDLFENMANAISSKYLADVKVATALKGSKPDFDELMAELQKLEQELTKKGVEIVESFKNKSDAASDTLTDELRNIIKSTIEGFVKEL